MFPNNQMDPSVPQWPMGSMPQAPMGRAGEAPEAADLEEGDNSHRPPNAFILYSQAMRSQVRQENPSLSNTEVSRLLGKMWKEVPNEIKLQYKQKAAAMQEEFKREHPDYTYRKARRKRALNELLTKSSTGFTGFPMGAPGFPAGDMSQLPQAGGMMPFGMANFPGSMPNPQGGANAQNQQSHDQQQPAAPNLSATPGAPGGMPGMTMGMPQMGMPGMAMGMPGMNMGMGQLGAMGANSQQPNMFAGGMGQFSSQK